LSYEFELCTDNSRRKYKLFCAHFPQRPSLLLLPLLYLGRGVFVSSATRRRIIGFSGTRCKVFILGFAALKPAVYVGFFVSFRPFFTFPPKETELAVAQDVNGKRVINSENSAVPPFHVQDRPSFFLLRSIY
jgi:hypothetical protein